MTKFDILRHCRLFELLTDEEMKLVADKVEERFFRKGDHVCREGAWGDSMYIIGAGEMKIIKKLSSETNWEITSLRHGDFFGEVALVDGSPRTASAVAMTNTTVLELFGRDFKVLMNNHESISKKMLESLLRVLINRIRATDDIVTQIMADKLKGDSQEAATLREVMANVMVNQKQRNLHR